MNYLKFSLVIFFVLAASRFIPHPPNFTPIISMAILSAYFMKNLKHSILLILSTMLITDIFLGFYKDMFFIYISLFIITLISFKLSSKIDIKNLFLYCIFSSITFFVITNFGVWVLGDLYDNNLQGLIECYFMAIPFFKNTLISTIVFSYAAYTFDYFYKKQVT
jgi:hypothetical protein